MAPAVGVLGRLGRRLRDVPDRVDARRVLAPKRALSCTLAHWVDVEEVGPLRRPCGDDPHVQLVAPPWGGFPAGLVVLSYVLEHPAEVPVAMELHVNTGDGFHEDTKTLLPVTRGGLQEVVVRLPSELIGLRLDVPADIGAFSLRDVQLRRAPQARREWTGPADAYRWWIEDRGGFDADARARIMTRIAALADPPKFSIVMPVHNPPLEMLVDAIDSVRGQLWPHWELCLADDASTDPAVIDHLDRLPAIDPRIKVVRRAVNGNISAASNDALALATMPWVVLLDHDDVLAERALYAVAGELLSHPQSDVVYSDEDKITPSGERHDPYFKPDFNEALLFGQNFVSHLGVYRRSLIEEVGGFRSNFDGSQDYDLLLRVLERSAADRIRHVPQILYHWRAHPGSLALANEEKDWAHDAASRALAEHLDRRGIDAHVEQVEGTRYRRVVSDRTAPSVEVIRVVQPCDANAAVTASDADVVVLVAVDVEATGDAFATLARLAAGKGIGAVGAKVLRPDGRLHHAGAVLHPDGRVRRVLDGHRADAHGPLGRAFLEQEFSVVAGGVMAMRREVFMDAGGLDEAMAFDDAGTADLSLRLRANGLAIMWTPHALFLRAGLPLDAPSPLLRERWSAKLVRDPFWSPHLDRNETDGRIVAY
ncbi:MAG: glycosyltransferase involved in cell wall biosynthesis [Glaciecola sp.]|jgi:glycosyltransferase involved in cell wall biosynthesis